MNFDMLGRLPPRTVGRVRELEQLCADYDGTDRNLVVGEVVSCYPDIPRYYLAWEGKKLVGALTARAARADTGMVSVCVHPEYRRRRIMRRLADYVTNILSWKGCRRILFACDANSRQGKAACHHSGLPLDHQSYLMRYTGGEVPAGEALRSRPGEPGDLLELGRLYAAQTGQPDLLSRNMARYVLDSKGVQCYTAWKDGELVGACSAGTEGECITLTRPVIAPNWRERDVERTILKTVLNEVSVQFQKPVLLGIPQENRQVVDLYTSSNFTVQSRLDYYVCQIGKTGV